jgi:hypothetical protein
MKRLTAVALLAIAVGAIMHFWPSADQPAMTPSASQNASDRHSPAAPSRSPALAQGQTTMPAPLPERAVQSGTVERPPVTPARFEIRAPATVRSGDTFPVTIEVQALRGIRQLAFSLTYKQSVLQLVRSSPGVFAQKGGASSQFEEVSDGSLLVRMDLESGVIAGAGSIAIVEFQALRRGVSPLSIEGVTYVEDGRQDGTNIPTGYEGSITVE